MDQEIQSKGILCGVTFEAHFTGRLV